MSSPPEKNFLRFRTPSARKIQSSSRKLPNCSCLVVWAQRWMQAQPPPEFPSIALCATNGQLVQQQPQSPHRLVISLCTFGARPCKDSIRGTVIGPRLAILHNIGVMDAWGHRIQPTVVLQLCICECCCVPEQVVSQC